VSKILLYIPTIFICQCT